MAVYILIMLRNWGSKALHENESMAVTVFKRNVHNPVHNSLVYTCLGEVWEKCTLSYTQVNVVSRLRDSKGWVNVEKCVVPKLQPALKLYDWTVNLIFTPSVEYVFQIVMFVDELSWTSCLRFHSFVSSHHSC